jgi:hypothetical protein
LLQNAFGEHYLQDSFAAGHLIDKTKIMQWFVEYLGRTGVELGSTASAKGQWAMVKTVAKQANLKSNPQALHDKIVRGEINSVAAVNQELGMAVAPEIVFMMWWRNAAKTNNSNKHLTPDRAAQLCSVGPAVGNAGEARKLMQALVDQGFAEIKTEGWIQRQKVFSLNQTQIDAVGNGGAYDAALAERMAVSGKPRDFTREAQEFNLAAYAAFLNNAYVQGATKFFHDKYCAKGLEVISGSGESLGRIYGDNAMMTAGAQKGVQYSADTSKWSREAIFNLLAGDDEVHTTAQIRQRFPAKAIDPDLGGQTLALDKWNEALKAAGDQGLFAEAKSAGARLAYKAKSGGGISGGHAIDVKAVTQHEVF